MNFSKVLITGCNGPVNGILWRNLADEFEFYECDLHPVSPLIPVIKVPGSVFVILSN